MSDLISRDALLRALDEKIELARKLDQHEKSIEAATICREMIVEQPEVRPQVIINVTGGIADVVAADYVVDVNVLDYDIVHDEQSDYIVDEDGDQAWLYGESAKPDPQLVQKILAYPTVDDLSDLAACQNCDWEGKETELCEIVDLEQRVGPGETMPAGECPECGALAQLVDAD